MKAHEERKFDKYKERGSIHWKEMMSKDIRVFNAYHRARYGWILKVAHDVHGKRVLDVGCGDGLLTYFLAKSGADVTGVDNEELGLQYAAQQLALHDQNKKLHYKFVQSSAYQMPFKQNSFDVVVSCEVIEHLGDPEKMLAESVRVLKEGGKFILTTPHRLTEFPQDKNHVKEYFPQELKKIVEKYFNNVCVKSTHHMLWRSLYLYAFRSFGNRQLFKWFLNIPILLFGWNPFMFDYDNPAKFDTFSSICIWGKK